MSIPTWLLVAGGIIALGVALSTAELSGEPLRKRLVERAREDLIDPVMETARNTGPVVDEYLAAVGEAPGSNWCAAAMAAWLRDAYASLGRTAPFRLVSGAELQGQLIRASGAGAWVDPSGMSRASCPPGTIVVWDRSTPPFSGFEGHIGVLEDWIDADQFHSIEGNSGRTGDRVARMVRTRQDPRLVGAVVLA